MHANMTNHNNTDIKILLYLYCMKTKIINDINGAPYIAVDIPTDHDGMFKLLLDWSFKNIDDFDKNEWTALSWAIDKKQYEVASTVDKQFTFIEEIPIKEFVYSIIIISQK